MCPFLFINTLSSYKYAQDHLKTVKSLLPSQQISARSTSCWYLVLATIVIWKPSTIPFYFRSFYAICIFRTPDVHWSLFTDLPYSVSSFRVAFVIFFFIKNLWWLKIWQILPKKGENWRENQVKTFWDTKWLQSFI